MEPVTVESLESRKTSLQLDIAALEAEHETLTIERELELVASSDALAAALNNLTSEEDRRDYLLARNRDRQHREALLEAADIKAALLIEQADIAARIAVAEANLIELAALTQNAEVQ